MPPKFHLVLLIHAHQPCGNFGHVFEQSFERCYLPFVEALEIFRSIFFDPGQQRPGIVETDVDTGVLLQSLKEWQIATRVGLLKNMAEVAARLMGVDE